MLIVIQFSSVFTVIAENSGLWSYDAIKLPSKENSFQSMEVDTTFTLLKPFIYLLQFYVFYVAFYVVD